MFVNRVDWRSRASLIMYRDAFRPSCGQTESENVEKTKEEPVKKPEELVLASDQKPLASSVPEPKDVSPDTNTASSITMSDHDSPIGEVSSELVADSETVIASDAKYDISDTKPDTKGTIQSESVETDKTVEEEKKTHQDTNHADTSPSAEHVVTVKEEVKKLETKVIDETDSVTKSPESETKSPVKEPFVETTQPSEYKLQESLAPTSVEPEENKTAETKSSIEETNTDDVSSAIENKTEMRENEMEIADQTNTTMPETGDNDVNETITPKTEDLSYSMITSTYGSLEPMDNKDSENETVNVEQDKQVVEKTEQSNEKLEKEIVDEVPNLSDSTHKSTDIVSAEIKTLDDSKEVEKTKAESNIKAEEKEIYAGDEEIVPETILKTTDNVTESEDRKDEKETSLIKSPVKPSAQEDTVAISTETTSLKGDLKSAESDKQSSVEPSSKSVEHSPAVDVVNDQNGKIVSNEPGKIKAPSVSENIDDSAKPLIDSVEKTEDKLLETVVKSEIIEKTDKADIAVVATSPTKDLPDKALTETDKSEEVSVSESKEETAVEKTTESGGSGHESIVTTENVVKPQTASLVLSSEEKPSENSPEKVSQQLSDKDDAQLVEQNEENFKENGAGEQTGNIQQSPLDQLSVEQSPKENEQIQEEIQTQSDTKDAQHVEQPENGETESKPTANASEENQTSIKEKNSEESGDVGNADNVQVTNTPEIPKSSTGENEEINAKMAQEQKSTVSVLETSGDSAEADVKSTSKDISQSTQSVETVNQSDTSVKHVTESKSETGQEFKQNDNQSVEDVPKDRVNVKSDNKSDDSEIILDDKTINSSKVNGDGTGLSVEEQPKPTDETETSPESKSESKQTEEPKINGTADTSDDEVKKSTVTDKIEKALLNGDVGLQKVVEQVVNTQSSGGEMLSEVVSGYETRGEVFIEPPEPTPDSQLSMKMMRGEVSAKTTYQRTSTGPIAISEVSPEGKFIVLENTSSGPNRRDVNLDSWRLRRAVDGKRDYTYNFRNYTLKAGKKVKILARGSASEAGLNDLVFRDEESWGVGSQVNTALINDKEEEKASHVQKTLYN